MHAKRHSAARPLGQLSEGGRGLPLSGAACRRQSLHSARLAVSLYLEYSWAAHLALIVSPQNTYSLPYGNLGALVLPFSWENKCLQGVYSTPGACMLPGLPIRSYDRKVQPYWPIPTLSSQSDL